MQRKVIQVWFVEILENLGRPRDAARLKEGPEGYPEMDDLQFLARLLGGQIVLQTSDVQIGYGDGPLYMHIAYTSCVDGAGHTSGHYAIYQSWRELVNRPKRRRVWTTQDEARGMDAEPTHISRPSTPLHERALSVADILRSLDKPTGDVPNRDVLVEECCDADDIVQATI